MKRPAMINLGCGVFNIATTAFNVYTGSYALAVITGGCVLINLGFAFAFVTADLVSHAKGV
jgi:hypothetical protein